MIRLRKADGTLLPVPPSVAAIEVCSTDGKLARIFLLGKDRVTVLDPTDEEFKVYAKAMREEIAELISFKS